MEIRRYDPQQPFKFSIDPINGEYLVEGSPLITSPWASMQVTPITKDAPTVLPVALAPTDPRVQNLSTFYSGDTLLPTVRTRVFQATSLQDSVFDLSNFGDWSLPGIVTALNPSYIRLYSRSLVTRLNGGPHKFTHPKLPATLGAVDSYSSLSESVNNQLMFLLPISRVPKTLIFFQYSVSTSPQLLIEICDVYGTPITPIKKAYSGVSDIIGVTVYGETTSNYLKVSLVNPAKESTGVSSSIGVSMVASVNPIYTESEFKTFFAR